MAFAAANTTLELIFGGDYHSETLRDIDNDDDDMDIVDEPELQNSAKRESVYVKALLGVIDEVDRFEQHLLTDEEWVMIRKFKGLPYADRFLLSKLVLRKWCWQPYSSLGKLQKEVGEEGLINALDTICRRFGPDGEDMEPPANVPPPTTQPPHKPSPDIIDLSLDSEDEDEEPVAGPSRLSPPPQQEPQPDLHEEGGLAQTSLDHFCLAADVMTLEECLDRLQVDQLKMLSRTYKLKANATKTELIAALLRRSKEQSLLDFSSPIKGKRKGRDGMLQTRLSFQPSIKKNLEAEMLKDARKLLGKCVRLNPRFLHLVHRLNLIYYRCTDLPKTPFLPYLLTVFKKRSYPEVSHSRCGEIFHDREQLLQYEAALGFERIVDDILELANSKDKSKIEKLTKAQAQRKAHPLAKDVVSSVEELFSEPSATQKARDEVGEEEALSVQKSRLVKRIFDERIFPLWEELVTKRAKEDVEEEKKHVLVKLEDGTQAPPAIRRTGLQRFEPGYVYTRLISKAASALGMLKEYEQEERVLNALLAQPYWRKGKRGDWYERRALIQINYLAKNDDEKKRKKKKEVLVRAREGLLAALRDEDTHLIVRPSLLNRLQKLEKTLKTPQEDRTECDGELLPAIETEVVGIKLMKRAASLQLGTDLRPKSAAVIGGGNGEEGKKPAIRKKPVWTGKSIWKGRDGDEVSVEIRALEHYEDCGFRGFHSETRILTTIFALLFWDIIFADVPGAFETPYQVAPLDLVDDTFYHSRKDLIQLRLEEIRNGKAKEIIERFDNMHRQKKTWCVGVQWDLCPLSDLLEIVDCLDASSLATVCQLFCEDYAARSSGVPDLIVWCPQTKECRFVEVKGPGDSASANQKLWFDTLLRAGIKVDLCKVVDRNKARAFRTGTGRGRGKAKAKAEDEDRPEQPDQNQVQDDDADYQLEPMDLDVGGVDRTTPATRGSKRPRVEDREEERPPLKALTASPGCSPTNYGPKQRAEELIESPRKRQKTG